MRVLFWIFVLLVAAVVALFAVANRETVALGLWPLPFVLEAPLYLIVLGAWLLGFAAGELAARLAGHRWRREMRRQTRRIAALEQELASTQAQLALPAERAPARLAARG